MTPSQLLDAVRDGSEKPLTMAQAGRRKELLGGRTVSPSQIWRWCKTGTKSRGGSIVLLGSYSIGRRMLTTDGALRRFLAEMNNETPPPASTPTHQRAKAQLREAGVFTNR